VSLQFLNWYLSIKSSEAGSVTKLPTEGGILFIVDRQLPLESTSPYLPIFRETMLQYSGHCSWLLSI
jgi:hypothetical protein